MARIRTIKPEFFTSDDVVTCSPLARLFYASLWCESDREGRLNWNPATLKRRYLAADDCDVSELAAELIGRDMLRLYEKDGRQYGYLPTFKKHQVLNNKEPQSTLPDPEKCSRVKDASKTRTARHSGEGKEGREGKGKELTTFPANQPPGTRKEPQPPTDQHKPFQHLSWKFYIARRDLLGDHHYDPWESKNLKQCKLILEGKAGGDIAEAERRARNLCLYARDAPAIWDVSPQVLLSNWPRFLRAPEKNIQHTNFDDSELAGRMANQASGGDADPASDLDGAIAIAGDVQTRDGPV